MKRFSTLALFLLCGAPLLAQRTVFTGTLLGSDGRPLPAAHVSLLSSSGNSMLPVVTSEVSSDGRYRLETNVTGIARLMFSGADHRPHVVDIFVDAPRQIETDVQLGTYAYPKKFDDVKVIGNFNRFDFDDARPMTRGKNGTYTATFKTDKPMFVYQLVFQRPDGMGAWSMNGTERTPLHFDGGGDYRSVLKPKNGRVTIVFDPSKLNAAPHEASVIYKDPMVRRITELMKEIEDRETSQREAIREQMRKGNDLSEYRYDWSGQMKSLADAIARETDPTIRGALMLSYAWLERQGAMDLDSTIAERALAELPPTSPLWSMRPEMLRATVAATGHAKDYEKYSWAAIESNPDTAVKVATLYDAVQTISYEEEPDRFNSYYNALEENFGGTREARWAKAEYSPTRNVMVGKSVPAFSLASLDHPSATISNESMKGKIYLIDFWATWCGPCVGEMENLHKAYEKFHGKNFEIVSLSFDRDREAIARFRKAKWKMPWMHAFVDGAFDSELAERFEVIGIPKPVLVDADGKIIATHGLRGSELERTLSRILDKDMSSAR